MPPIHTYYIREPETAIEYLYPPAETSGAIFVTKKPIHSMYEIFALMYFKLNNI